MKKKKRNMDLTYTFPSRSARLNWLRESAILNLRYVANRIQEKNDEIITIGFDDTTKAAGKQLLDVKTTHITIAGPSNTRETFTTGYTPNISHSGSDQAKTHRHSLEVLAVLARSDNDAKYDANDICDAFDFWMADRSNDGDAVLDELGVDADKA